MSKSMPIGTVEPMTRLQGQGQETTSFSSLPISDTEDDLPGKGLNSNWLSRCRTCRLNIMNVMYQCNPKFLDR